MSLKSFLVLFVLTPDVGAVLKVYLSAGADVSFGVLQVDFRKEKVQQFLCTIFLLKIYDKYSVLKDKRKYHLV